MKQSKIAKSYESIWRESRRTKKLLKFFSTDDQVEGVKGTLNDDPPPYSKAQLIGLILGPLLFIITLLFLNADGLTGAGVFVVASTIWIATWWITEAIPIPVTSLMPLFLFPMGQVMDHNTVSSNYGNDIIFLFLGGFLLAIAMEKWNLHTRVALTIIRAIGTTTGTILLGFMLSTAFLSMFVSNTAATMIMIPIGLAIIKEAHSLSTPSIESDVKKFEKALILAIGYAATIGGLGTLIGTPPLIILAGQMEALFDYQMSFGQWMLVGVPVVLLLLLLAWVYINKIAFKHSLTELPGGRDIIQRELKALGKTTKEEYIVLAVFFCTAFLWIIRGFFLGDYAITELLRDGSIAMIAAVILFLIPTNRKDKRILTWSVAKDLPWGVLLLFGGGLALADAIGTTEVDLWLGEMLSVIDGLPILLMILIVAVLILFLTEITSNTATATMILPVLAGLAIAIDVHPLALMAPAAMAANCAFMLPVGTPPNAIIFATDKIQISEMVRVGVWLNVLAAIILVLYVYMLFGPIYGIDLMENPFK